MHQHHPEFTHSSFNRLRSLEDAFVITNYLDTKTKQLEQQNKAAEK
jgi:hypothetical protein